MIAGLSMNIINRESSFSLTAVTALLYVYLEASIKQIETDLRTTSEKISLSLSLFIFVLCGVPLLWTSISEIKGRKVRIHCIRYLSCLPRAVWTYCLFKLVYIVSLAIGMVGYIAAAVAKSIDVFIGMRIIQAFG